MPKGHFTGVPFFLKDICAFAEGLPTRQGVQFISAVPGSHDSLLTNQVQIDLLARIRISGVCGLGGGGLVPANAPLPESPANSRSHQGVVKIHRCRIEGFSFVYRWESAMVLQITPVERAVLQLLADGSPTIDIAKRLGLSGPAIDTILMRLLERMGAASPVQAVADAHRRGLLSTQHTEELPATR